MSLSPLEVWGSLSLYSLIVKHSRPSHTTPHVANAFSLLNDPQNQATKQLSRNDPHDLKVAEGPPDLPPGDGDSSPGICIYARRTSFICQIARLTKQGSIPAGKHLMSHNFLFTA